MKDRPILSSAPMVRAILAGTKTQTRRIVSPQPNPQLDHHKGRAVQRFRCVGLVPDGRKGLPWWQVEDESGPISAFPDGRDSIKAEIGCPYGQPGDRLWVREAFAIETNFNLASESEYPPPFSDGRPIRRQDDYGFGEWWEQPHYRATDPEPELSYEDGEGNDPQCRWKPSIHMPRWASRITLEITGVRVERLQEISTLDAIAEGIDEHGHDLKTEMERDEQRNRSAIENYVLLWDSLNASRGFGWDANPWVWVIEFRRITGGTR